MRKNKLDISYLERGTLPKLGNVPLSIVYIDLAKQRLLFNTIAF